MRRMSLSIWWSLFLSACTVTTSAPPPSPPPRPPAPPARPGPATSALSILRLVPSMAPVGGVVRIVFSDNLDLTAIPAATISVTVGGVRCPVIRTTRNAIDFKVPQGVPQRADVVVRLPKSGASAGAVLTAPVQLRLLPSKGAFAATVTPGHGLLGEVFRLSPGTSGLPDFSRLGQPIGTFLIPNLDIPPRNFQEGFPGVQGDIVEWFAIQFTGRLNIPRGGPITFRLLSDDGAKLFVDGRLAVDNDGIHPPRSASATVQLSPGQHRIEVQYFQGPRYQIALQLFWTLPGQRETVVPPDRFLR